MTGQPAQRLVDECAHLRPVEDPALDALRRALLVEDVLGLRLSDDQIDLALLTDADALSALANASTSRD